MVIISTVCWSVTISLAAAQLSISAWSSGPACICTKCGVFALVNRAFRELLNSIIKFVPLATSKAARKMNANTTIVISFFRRKSFLNMRPIIMSLSFNVGGKYHHQQCKTYRGISRLSKDRFRDRDRDREIKKELIAQFY